MEEWQNVNPQTKATKERGAEYTAIEILLLSKAWISASENTLTGVSQKITTFWDSVFKAYNTLKQQHEEYMQWQKEKKEFGMKKLCNNSVGSKFDSSDDTDGSVMTPTKMVQKNSTARLQICRCFQQILKEEWRRQGGILQPHPYFFLKENEGETSFDVYRSSWEYLKDKPKFTVSCTASSRGREIITLDDNGDKIAKVTLN